MSLQSKISQARRQAKLSQQQLGKIIGVSDKAVSAYEVGRSSPPLKILQKISTATGKSLPYFIETHPASPDTILIKLENVEKELQTIRKQLQNRNSTYHSEE